MKTNYEELYKQINKWKKERGLTIKNQKEGLINNLREEIIELIEAVDVYNEIDALCDISVFCIGCLTSKKFNKNIQSGCSLDDIALYYKMLKKKITNECLLGIIYTCEYCIYGLNFDYFKCMQETIKEISSRTGKYDDEAKKWIKDTSDEAKAKWYKADYSKCKSN